MGITETQLKELIKESIEEVINEAYESRNPLIRFAQEFAKLNRDGQEAVVKIIALAGDGEPDVAGDRFVQYAQSLEEPVIAAAQRIIGGYLSRHRMSHGEEGQKIAKALLAAYKTNTK
jgi:HEAT repeat protein